MFLVENLIPSPLKMKNSVQSPCSFSFVPTPTVFSSPFPLFFLHFFFSFNFVFLVFCVNVTFSFSPIELPHSPSSVCNALFSALQVTGNRTAGTNTNKCLPFWSYKLLEAWMTFAISPFFVNRHSWG